MEITTEMIKGLRDQTGVAVMQCKKALEEAGGDIEKAKVILRKQSSAIASKKSDRALGAGIAAAYTHAGGAVWAESSVVFPSGYASPIALLTSAIERTDVSFAGTGYCVSEKSQSELERPMTGILS